jgi:hypothetical protein
LLGLGSDGRGQTIEDDQRDAHNEAMNALIEAAQTREAWAIMDRGRSDDERALVLMENEHVKGWCFTNATVSRFDEIPELVELKNGSATADAIVQHALHERELGKIRFEIIEPA